MHGTYETIDGRPALRFERELAHPIETVWHAITTPGELDEWFPTTVSGEVVAGGALRFEHRHADLPHMHGKVIDFDPPRLFAFTWGGDHLRFDLEPLGAEQRTLLRLTVLLDVQDKAARDASGWHVTLDGLERHLAGGSAPASGEATDAWRGLYEEYQRRGLPTGAPVPS